MSKIKFLCLLIFLFSFQFSFAQRIFKQIEKGNLKAVQKYLDKGKDVNVHKNFSYQDVEEVEKVNLLSYAVYYGHKDILECFVEHKSNFLNYQEALDQALLKGSMKGELEICQFLLDEGANLNANCIICHGRSPLQIAVGYEHWELADYYINKGADIQHVDSDQWNLLHLIACSNNVAWGKNILLKGGLNINQQNKDGLTPLMYAVGNGHLEMFEFLLENGAKIDLVDNQGEDVLLHAIQNKQDEIVKRLIELKANINTKDKNGTTSLLWAIWLENRELIKLLIEQGIDLNSVIQGKTYLEHAKETIKDKEFLNYLSDKVAK